MDNIMTYIEAIEAAVRREVARYPRSERSMAVGLVASALVQTSETLKRFKDDLEENGEATPVSDEQIAELRMMFREALSKRRPES